MLKAILMVTLLSLNLQTTEDAYIQLLDYEVIQRGTVDESLAIGWGAEKMAGQRYLIMRPQSKSNVLLRFIESEQARNYRPMRQEGWNATEILVQDPKKLAKKLKGSPFRVVGPPAYLTDKKNTLAFQAQGPDNELLYFTRIIDPKKSSFDLGQANSFVDRVFIMVLGGKDMAGMEGFYRDTLKQPVSGPYPYRIGVLSKAYGLPPETIHSLAIATLPRQFLIEIDQYPQTAKPIHTKAGLLPAGVAMVSFQVDSLSGTDLPFTSPPKHRQAPPYNGRRSATVKGAAGELLELIETQIPHTPENIEQ